MDEAGDPTPKYMLIRDAIKDYLPLPNIPVPVRAPKMTLSPVRLNPILSLLSPAARSKLGSTPIKSQFPLTFEKIDQYSGFVLYEAILPPKLKFDPTIFAIPKLNDRAHVLIDDVSVNSSHTSIRRMMKQLKDKMNSKGKNVKKSFFRSFPPLHPLKSWWSVYCREKIWWMRWHWMPASRANQCRC